MPLLIFPSALLRTFGSDPRPVILVGTDMLVLILMPILAILNLVLHLDVGDDGIAVRPVGVRLRWSQIARVESPRAGSVSVVRTDRTRRSGLTSYGIGRARARALAERLQAELSAS